MKLTWMLLVSHFGNKFKPTICNAGNQSRQYRKQREREREVDSHYQHIQGVIYHDIIIEEDLIQYIKRLKVKRAPGIDGITAEHLLNEQDSNLVSHVPGMLSLCLRFGVVPQSFAQDLLILYQY